MPEPRRTALRKSTIKHRYKGGDSADLRRGRKIRRQDAALTSDAANLQQSLDPPVVEFVALARRPFEPRAVDDGDLAAPVADKARALQFARGLADARSPHPEHRGEEFLGETQHLGVGAVARHQQPARGALLDLVQTVAGGGLSRIC